MTQTRLSKLLAIALLLVGLEFHTAAQPARMLSRLPAPVQKTIHAQAAGGRIEGIDKQTDDQETVYDVQLVRNGQERSFGVAEDGTLMYTQVFLSELSDPLQHAIHDRIKTGTPGEIDRVTDGGEESYDVEFTRDGTNRNFSLNAKGELLSEQVFLSEVPPAVKAAIQKQGGTLGEIEKSIDDGEVTYDVDTTRDGKECTFTIGADGRLVSTEVFLNELPATLQKAIQDHLGTGKLDDITQSFSDGATSYDVDVIEGGKTRTMTFDDHGQLSSEEEAVKLSDAPEAVRTEIQTLAHSAKVGDITQIKEHGEVSYDVELHQEGGKVQTLHLGPDGKVLPQD